MRALVSRVAMLALVAAIGNAAVTDPGHAQGASIPPAFTKQALDNNGVPLAGPVSVGQTIQYVLSYNSGTSPLGAVTINDTLSSNLAYVNSSIVAPPGWTWTLPGYSPGNQEVYSNSGFGPGTSFIVNVPVADLAQAGPPGGDGFYPIPVPAVGRVFGIFHHKPDGSGVAKIMCWELLSLAKCPGYEQLLDSATDPRATPQTVRAVVIGTRIYYPSARNDASQSKNFFGIGCWDASGPGAPCAFIPLLPATPLAGPSYPGTSMPAGGTFSRIIAGVVADPANPNRLFMYAVDKVYCVDVTASPATCSGWLPPTLTGTGSEILDIMAGEGTPGRLYVQYGITTGNKATVACLEMASGSRCALWPTTDVQAPMPNTAGRYGTLSPALSNTGTMAAVCLHPYVSGFPADTMTCFDPSTGGTPVIPTAFVTALNTADVITAFHIPNTQRVLYAGYTNPILCFDFAVPGLCASFTPAWTTSNNFLDYGYAVDPAAPDRCLLGLGHTGVLWRFTRGGGFDANGCGKPVEATFDINSFFCAIKPKQAAWGSIVIRNRPTQLTGGTINLVNSAGVPVIPQITVGNASTYPVNVPVTAANSQVTIQFTPAYSPSAPPNGYQLELTFTADVDPQICYKATVKECGPVSNQATLTGSLIGPAAPVPFKATVGVNLGNATGPQCEPGLLKVCKVAGPGIAIGTPFTFTAGSSKFAVPAGPAPGGTCMIGPTFPVGSNVTVDEDVPPGYTVSSITVASPKQLVGTPNLAAGSVNVIIGSGVTVVTFIDKLTGFLEICKRGDVTGNFSFTVSPGGLGPFVVPAGACSPPIEVIAGSVVVTEQPTTGNAMVSCTTFPAGQQGLCDPKAQTSTVTVAAGDVSTETIAFITNKRQ